MATPVDPNTVSPSQALQRLQEGNGRFVNGEKSAILQATAARLGEFADGQKPFAIVLGCSDSRVPVEIVFDQAFGDVFVIRIAGNVVAPSQIASVEFAAVEFGTPLVVVLGHSGCGAVTATLNHLQQPGSKPAGSLGSIVRRIRPAVEPLLDSADDVSPDVLLARAVRANIQASVAQLLAGSSILEDLIMRQQLTIIGAEYSLASGKVEFLDAD